MDEIANPDISVTPKKEISQAGGISGGGGKKDNFLSFFSQYKKNIGIILFILVVAGLFYFSGVVEKFGSPRYEEPYTLVPEKISQSAAILVRLPEGIRMDADQAVEKITFEPVIAGEWISGKNDSELIFRPKTKLEFGKYYSVILAADEIRLEKDFLIDEDPRVISVFPDGGSEASEYSSITIVFNRPMVPLTTLDVLAKENVPVEILPQTPGRFKWITTRNLQFIPETRLQRSSSYIVRIKQGLVSLDGLSVAELEHRFTTRPLRYEDGQQGRRRGVSKTLYSQPIRIFFNQPVDIERTKQEFELTQVSRGRVDFTATYGVRSIYNEETRKYEHKLDKSILEIYNAQDRHGRKGFWDFNTNYSYVLKKAYPLEGDIDLRQSIAGSIATTDIIDTLSAESPRTEFAEPDLFDPQGKLWVTFFEDIDKDASSIDADLLKEIGYGEKCREPEEGEEVSYGKDCEKVTDYKRLSFTFDESKFKRGQQISLEFKKIFNRAGLRLNAETVTRSVTAYPELVVYKTVPAEGSLDAALTGMTLCTSNPLAVPDETTFYEWVKSNVTIGLWNWYPPFRVRSANSNSLCSPGQFQNTIRYGLVPEFPYKIALSVVDDFGQKISREVNFTSGKLSSFSRNFFHMQGRYNVTSPERTKLTFAVDNLEYVDMHICKISAETMLSYIEKRPNISSSPASLNCEQVFEKRIDLPKRYWSRVYFQANLNDYVTSPLGHYVVTFSHPDYRRVSREWNSASRQYVERVEGQLYEKSLLTVTKLAVQEKKIDRPELDIRTELDNAVLSQFPQNLYWVTEFGTLASVIGAKVDLYRKGQERVGSYSTDSDGIALTDTFEGLVGAVVRKDGDSAIVSSGIDRLQWGSSAVGVERTYLYTDRPIYRPGDKVSIKGLYRIGYDAQYEIFRDNDATIEIRDSNYDVALKKQVSISDYGTFITEFTLDAHAPLGTYSMAALDGYVTFDVEEYVPAAFKVETNADKEEYIAGGMAKISVNAEYYFGVPVEGGEVEYSVTTQNYYFDRYHDGYFRFGNDWYYDFDGYYGDTFISRGKVPLNKGGKASIEQQLDFAKLFKEEDGEKSKIFTVNITVKNKNGESISSQKSFIVHRGTFYAGINSDKNFLGKGEKTSLRIKTVDINGKEISANNILLEIKKIRWESYKRLEVDGNYYYRTEQKKETVQKDTLHTDRSGNASYEFALNDPGEYEASVSVEDADGNPIKATYDVYVSGTGSVTIRPTNNETLDLATDKGKVDVGEKIKIIIKSPFERAKALITLERGKIFKYDIISLTSNLVEYTFQVAKEHIPNLFASVLLISPDPEVKYGHIEYQVNTAERELDITVRSHKNNYLPGEEVWLEVETRDKKGNPVGSEVSLAVVDMSVLALKGNPKKDPVLFFYNGSPLTVSTASNIKNILHEADIPTGTKGGGGGSEDLAKKKRGVFKDTAFWEGVVHTDANGKTKVSFVLPDNLTTWQIESVGITKDTKVGVGYEEFKAQKDLMVVPLRPRFIIPGDQFFVGAKIFNETPSRQKLKIDIMSDTLLLTGKREISVSIEPHDTMTVYFPAEAPQNIQDGEHVFTLSAKNNDYEDTVENSIKITRNNTYESVATASYTNAEVTREYVYLPPNVLADRGGLEIKTSATLAVFLSDALNYLVEYPYGCSEQIASKLSALGILKRGLNLKNIADAFTLKDVEFEGQAYTPDDVVRIGLARLYENQDEDGGFAYYKGMEPNYYLTLHIAGALMDLKDAGYEVEDERIENAKEYIVRELKQKQQLLQDKDLLILVGYTLFRIDGAAYDPNVKNRIMSVAQDEAFIQEKISNVGLSYLAILIANDDAADSLEEDVFDTLENRLVIDSRGASLRPQGDNYVYQFYETPIKDTALMIKALAKSERENPVLDKMLRWILRSRAKDGAWGSTNNTVTVIDALTDFLVWKKENESQFDLALVVDQNALGEFSFDKNSILKTFEKFVPIQEIGLGKLRSLVFTKTNKNTAPNNYYYDAMLKYYLPVEKISSRDEGFSITRELYRADDEKRSKPVSEAKQGDVLRVRLVITTPTVRNFVSVEDYIPAGMEIVNLRLATEDQSLREQNPGYDDLYRPYYYYEDGAGAVRGFNLAGAGSFLRQFFGGVSPITPATDGELEDDFYGKQVNVVAPFWPDANELHDDRAFLFKERLLPGVYEYEYFVRALVPGTFHHLPAVVNEMYFPENFGRTRGDIFMVKEAQ
ncbi:MAG: alpha-2-macroglobulin family protein [bacterium]|nr:alpha-2-macroglobulin family protein [bacterium]